MNPLEARVARLERTNRRLFLALGVGAALLATGFQKTQDVLRTRRIEVVDERGVPLAILASARDNGGGELTLRDADGERRVNLAAERGGASLRLQGGKADDPAGTAALRADATGAALGLVGSRAAISAAVRKDRPRIATTDGVGKETFVAPWKSSS